MDSEKLEMRMGRFAAGSARKIGNEDGDQGGKLTAYGIPKEAT